MLVIWILHFSLITFHLFQTALLPNLVMTISKMNVLYLNCFIKAATSESPEYREKQTHHTSRSQGITKVILSSVSFFHSVRLGILVYSFPRLQPGEGKKIAISLTTMHIETSTNKGKSTENLSLSHI